MTSVIKSIHLKKDQKREHRNDQYQEWKKGITTDHTDINKLIRKYHKLYTHKFNMLDEISFAKPHITITHLR